jgi:hypothetical protein
VRWTWYAAAVLVLPALVFKEQVVIFPKSILFGGAFAGLGS